MAGITLEQAQAKLQTWLDAEDGLAVSQSYTIGSADSTRTLTRSDLAKVAERIQFWNNKVISLSNNAAGRSRTRYSVI